MDVEAGVLVSIGQWYETPKGVAKVVYRHRQKQWVFGRPREGDWCVVELMDGTRTSVRTCDLGSTVIVCDPDEAGGARD